MDRRQLSASTTSQSMMSSDTIPRPLTLHISALSNEEFELYTRSLEELATLDNTVTGSSRTSSHSSYYEQLSFNSGDIRAWLKGRYPYVTIEKIDSILRFMISELGPHVRFSGGQVLVALRLLTHLIAGEHVTRERAFYQAVPNPKTVPHPRNNTRRPTSETIVRVQPQKPVSPTSTSHSNRSEVPLNYRRLSSSAGTANTIPEQSASSSALNNPHPTERPSNSHRPSAPIATTNVQSEHSPPTASSQIDGTALLSDRHRPSVATMTEQARQSSAASVTHNADDRLSNSQQPSVGTKTAQLPQINIPSVTNSNTGHQSPSHIHRTPNTQSQTSHQYSHRPLVITTETSKPNSPPRPQQSDRAVGSIGKIVIPPIIHFRSKNPSTKAPGRAQNTKPAQVPTPTPETISARLPNPSAQQHKSNAEKDPAIAENGQASTISKPSDSNQPAHSTERPRESNPSVGIQPPAPPVNQPQSTLSQPTPVAQVPHLDLQLPKGMTIRSQVQPARSKMRKARKSVTTNAAPKEKSLRSKQKTPVKGDIVTAKLDGYPPWPGEVCDIEKLPAEIMQDRPCPEITSRCAEWCDDRICGEMTWPIRFFPEGDYAWVPSKDITQLSQHEIVGYLQSATKSVSADLIEGYQIALDPAPWLETQSREEGSSDNSSPSTSKDATGSAKNPKRFKQEADRSSSFDGVWLIPRPSAKRTRGSDSAINEGPPAFARKRRPDAGTSGSAVRMVKKPRIGDT